jgi:hypothetical protein
MNPTKNLGMNTGEPHRKPGCEHRCYYEIICPNISCYQYVNKTQMALLFSNISLIKNVNM